jgi:hypothetical protein
MKILTVLCNIVLVAFTALVLVTDGAPTSIVYMALTLLLMAIPVFTVCVVLRAGKTAMARAAAVCNVVLLALICWAIVDQYPHPPEEGVVAFTALTVSIPILNAVVLLFRPRGGRHVEAAATART